MNTLKLEPLEHAPEIEGDACPLLTREQIAAVDETMLCDDMAGFLSAAKSEVARDFLALGFGHTAAGELAEIHVGMQV